MKIASFSKDTNLVGRGAKSPWSAEEVKFLHDNYGLLSVSEISDALGRSKAAIRNRAYDDKITVRDDSWTEQELQILRDAYSGEKLKGELNIAALAKKLGRSKSAISTKARKFGLSSRTRKGIVKPKVDKRRFKTEADRSNFRSEFMRARHAQDGHPMQGKRHSYETLKRISNASKEQWKNKTEEQRTAWVEKAMKAKIAKFGSVAPKNVHGNWKAGWREIGGKRKYYRSRWEANYARYLEWLKSRGLLLDWAHEPETFWFEPIKRGVRSYLPDFRVWELDGSTKLYEIKGWMDARSKTTLRRMAKYHPHETIILVREKEYNAVARIVRDIIPDWEHSERKDRP